MADKTPSSTAKEKILALLTDVRDESTLLEIARSIHQQVLALNSPAEDEPETVEPIAAEDEVDESAEKPQIIIELKEETWHATRQTDGRSFGLCTRLSRGEVEKQMRVRQPEKISWEIPADEGRKMKKRHPHKVEFFDEKKGNITTRHYYLTEEYGAAMEDWRKYVALAEDAITQGLGLSVSARAAIAKLESEGYEIILPNNLDLQKKKS